MNEIYLFQWDLQLLPTHEVREDWSEHIGGVYIGLHPSHPEFQWMESVGGLYKLFLLYQLLGQLLHLPGRRR